MVVLSLSNVLNATARKKQSCLCKFCLNIRLRFVQYEKLLNDKLTRKELTSKLFSIVFGRGHNSCK